MKEKVLYLILGILIGSVITAGCFLVFSKNQQPGMMRGEPPEGFENMVQDGRFDGNFVPPEMENGKFNPKDMEERDSSSENKVAEQ